MQAQHRLDDGADSFATPHERRQRERAEKNLRDAQIKAAKALHHATDAMRSLLFAYYDAHPEAHRKADDGRILLIESMTEFASYLDSINERIPT